MKDKSLVGAAGEHLVLSRLLSRGLLASQAPRGTMKVDILVNPHDGGMPRLIQVKTRSPIGKTLGWHMGAKHEHMQEENLFYCFVNLDLLQPSVWVIPSKVVANVVADSHQEWLDTPGHLLCVTLLTFPIERSDLLHRKNLWMSFNNSYTFNTYFTQVHPVIRSREKL